MFLGCRDIAHLFKGIWDSFGKTEWNFRNIGIQSFLDSEDACSKCYMILGTFSKYFRDTGYWGPSSRASTMGTLLFETGIIDNLTIIVILFP